MLAARAAPRPAQSRGGAEGCSRPGALWKAGGGWVPPAGVSSTCEMAVRGPRR